MSFLKKNLGSILACVLLGLILIFFTLATKKAYTFDWDQANDYEAVAQIASGKFTLIGPRVTSDTGFFLGPWHYYFLLPFYLLSKGSLYMGFGAALFVQYLMVIASYFVAKKWFGPLAGFTTAVLFATPGVLTEWGFMYVPLLSILFLYLCLKALDNPKIIPWLFLMFGFSCTTYTVFYALGIPFAYVVISLFLKRKFAREKIILSLGLFALPYSPLLFFDLRHNFLNLRNIFSFFGGQHGQGQQAGYFLLVFFRAIEFSWLYRNLPVILAILSVIAGVLILIYGAWSLFPKKRMFMFLWLVSSLIPMMFFKGNVSEYYYAPVITLIPFFLSGVLVKKGSAGKLLLLFLVLSLAVQRFRDRPIFFSRVSLADKINVVEKMESLGSKYSISYELELGEDAGYKTIFNTLGKNYIEDGSSQLYTITSKGKVVSGTLIAETQKLAVYKR